MTFSSFPEMEICAAGQHRSPVDECRVEMHGTLKASLKREFFDLRVNQHILNDIGPLAIGLTKITNHSIWHTILCNFKVEV
jgi:hypothetical protein